MRNLSNIIKYPLTKIILNIFILYVRIAGIRMKYITVYVLCSLRRMSCAHEHNVIQS